MGVRRVFCRSGRANCVGKPIAQLLLKENCTVNLAHSRTRDLASVIHRADIVVADVGIPEMVKGDWIKPGAVVIDVGINRIAGTEEGKTRLVGDVATSEEIGREQCRERGCQSVWISVVAVELKTKK